MHACNQYNQKVYTITILKLKFRHRADSLFVSSHLFTIIYKDRHSFHTKEQLKIMTMKIQNHEPINNLHPEIHNKQQQQQLL